MPDKDWIAKLQPDEAEAALKKLAELMDQPLSPRFATRLQTLERAIKAKAGSTYGGYPLRFQIGHHHRWLIPKYTDV